MRMQRRKKHQDARHQSFYYTLFLSLSHLNLIHAFTVVINSSINSIHPTLSESNVLFKLYMEPTESVSIDQQRIRNINSQSIDNRPHEQRVKQQRKARRLNHAFMHLYRHDSPLFDDQLIAPSSKSMTCAETYLMEYGSFLRKDKHSSNVSDSANNGLMTKTMIEKMSREFPPLLELDVKRHLRPKMRFLKYTLGCSVEREGEKSTIRNLSSIPPQYFGARLEKIIAPRHAFLMSKGLPHGKVLLDNDAVLFKEFMYACRRSKSFAVLCNQWKEKYGQSFTDKHYQEISKNIYIKKENWNAVTSQEVDAFDSLFTR